MSALPQLELAAPAPSWATTRARLLTRDVLGMVEASASCLPPGWEAEALTRAATHLQAALDELEAPTTG